MGKWSLLTFAPSHYCEKARWVLKRYAIPYIEIPHVPVVHFFAALFAGLGFGRITFPVLISEDKKTVLRDSGDILKYVDSIHPELYVKDQKVRDEIDRFELIFNNSLGKAVRVSCYEHILPSPVFSTLFTWRKPAWEAWLIWLFTPLLRVLVRQGYNISPANVKRSNLYIDTAFKEVEKALSDGRPFLCGDRFTAADLTFASLAAPLVCPSNYGGFLGDYEAFPEAAKALVQKYRARTAGQFVLKLYKEERDRVVNK